VNNLFFLVSMSAHTVTSFDIFTHLYMIKLSGDEWYNDLTIVTVTLVL